MSKGSISKTFKSFDASLIVYFKQNGTDFSRIAIFIVYFWFGFLKAVDLSPAAPLVGTLFERTLAFMPFEPFYVFFAIFEMVIGVLFLIKGLERIALVLLSLHLITTVLPLFFVAEATWQGLFLPTLEGQYIIKNILIIAAAIHIASSLKPLQHKNLNH